jgi:hypothetical protein
MKDDSTLAPGGANRRENFRIDCVLPISIRKISKGLLPTARIFPVAANSQTAGGVWEGTLTPTMGEFDSNFALMLIEVNAKLDLLLAAQHLRNDAESLDPGPVKLSMNQLLLQINLKLEQLLGAQRLTRHEERMRIDTVSISASGVKLKTEEALSDGDLVEVRMLLGITTPFWVVVGGTVVRATTLPNGKREVAINFIKMSEPVQDEIARYALANQKKQLMARRGIQ